MMVFPRLCLLRMARKTTRQKHVHLVLVAYQHIKRLQLRRKQRRAVRRQPTNHHVDTDSASTTTSKSGSSLSLSSVLDSISLLSLSSMDPDLDQGDVATGTRRDSQASRSGMSLDSNDSSQSSSPVKYQRKPRGLKALRTVSARQFRRSIHVAITSTKNLAMGDRLPTYPSSWQRTKITKSSITYFDSTSTSTPSHSTKSSPKSIPIQCS